MTVAAGKYGKHIEIRDPTDEFLTEGKIHFEAMDDRGWYCTILTPDGWEMLVYFTAAKGKLTVTISEVNAPRSGGP